MEYLEQRLRPCLAAYLNISSYSLEKPMSLSACNLQVESYTSRQG